MEEEKISLLDIMSDPARWSETFLRNPRDKEKNLKLRSYQKIVLENTRKYKNMILRYGRRMGKCLRGNSLILNEFGQLIKVKDYLNKSNFGVFSLNDNYEIEQSNSTTCFSNGIKSIFKLKTKSGRYIDCTKNHPLLTISGWTTLEDLNIGDSIAVPSKIDINTSHEIDDEKVKVLAYLLSDGCITSYVKFGNENDKILNEFLECINYFDCTTKLIKIKNKYKEYYVSGKKHTKGNNAIINYLRTLDLFGKNSHSKFIPNEIMSLSKRQQILFLSRLFACDGWASVSKSNRKSGNCEIGYSSVSEELIHGVGHLLTRFGIRYFITEKKVKYNGSYTKAYQLCIRTKKDIIEFINTINIFSKEKACENVLKYINIRKDKETYFDSLPTQEVMDIFNIKHPRKHDIRKHYKRTSKFKLLEYANETNNVELKNICSSDIFYDEIVDIIYVGEEETFDLEVFPNHNFIANDIIVHNSVTMCTDTLWWATAYPYVDKVENNRDKLKPKRIILATPYETQIKELWGIYTSLIADSPLMKSQVLKIRTSDVHSIEFVNGSKIEGYTIGISSSNKGTSLRSLSADILFIDEMDFIPREIMEEVIIPIATTHKDCLMRVCSTPSGKRELFWEWSTRAEELGWFHRHYPSWHPDNDNWMSIEQAKEKGIPITESTEFQVKAITSSERFAREYGADFGEELGGVYKHSLVSKALVKYGRNINVEDTDIFDPKFQQVPENLYVMGVDWNSYVNGGQIVVVEYCRAQTIEQYYDDEAGKDVEIDFTNKFRLFYRRGIKSKNSTQRATREEIIRICKQYRIDHIYVDYGHGDTNIEELTFYGKKHPEMGLERKLHAVDSGAVTQHWDPVLREKVNKRNKSLMVNLSVLNFEEGRVLLPKEEDQKTRLVGQIRGYVVKNVTSRGDFSYEGEDHILDAFNLALFGFSKEYDPGIFTNKQIYTIVRTSDPRMSEYPQRETSFDISKRSTDTSMNIRDPEAPINYVQKPVRINMPSRRQLGINFRRTF